MDLRVETNYRMYPPSLYKSQFWLPNFSTAKLELRCASAIGTHKGDRDQNLKTQA